MKLQREVAQTAANTVTVLDDDYSALHPPTVPATLPIDFRGKRYDALPAGGIMGVVLLRNAAAKVGPATLRLTVRLVRCFSVSVDVGGVLSEIEHAVSTAALADVTPGVPFTFDSVAPGRYFIAVTAQTGAAGGTFTHWSVRWEEV